MSASQSDVNRRRAQRRKKIRQRRILISLFFLLLTALAVLVVLSLTVLFPVKTVKASGSELYSSEQIRKASGINETCNIFTLPVKQVEKNIHAILPYADTIKVKRVLPDTIELYVTDATEYACYFVDGEYFAVSERGYVLNRYSEQPEGIFLIKCNGVKCAVGTKVEYESTASKELVSRLLSGFKEYGIKVNAVDASDEYNIHASVDDRFDVLFGNEDDIEKKLAHLSSMIKNIAPERGGKIDLSMWSAARSEGTFTETVSQ